VNVLWGLLWASVVIFWLWALFVAWLRHRRKRDKRR
jgi:hypothetical protein